MGEPEEQAAAEQAAGSAADAATAAAEGLADGDLAEQGSAWELKSLPPMPEPKHKQLRVEASRGCLLTSALIVSYVGASLGIALGAEDLPEPARWGVFGLTLAQAAVAVACLAGVLLSDPGVLQRRPETCFPLPDEIAGMLRRGESLELMQNIESGDRSFCVRCLVWRPGKRGFHHCSACQRCVRFFDHHCAVLGRCITGSALCFGSRSHNSPCFSGNMPYFIGLLAMALSGTATCVGAAVAALLTLEDKAAMAAGLSVLLLCCCCGTQAVNSICIWVSLLCRRCSRWCRRAG